MSKKIFSMPKSMTIMGRISSITNSFVNGIIPVIKPSTEEIKDAIETLGMTEDSVCCAYCGDNYTEWDHFHPLIRGKEPTGYISEIHNLVPSCSKCNESKGCREWREWIQSNAQKSPKTRGVQGLESRIERLKIYEEKFKCQKIDFKAVVGEEKWNLYWKKKDHILHVMEEAQELSNDVKKHILGCFSDSAFKPRIIPSGTKVRSHDGLEDFRQWLYKRISTSSASNYMCALRKILVDARMDFPEFVKHVSEISPLYMRGGEKETVGNVCSGGGRAVIKKIAAYIEEKECKK